MDDTFKNTYTDSADLAKFLERPVLIRSYAWQEGTSLNTTFTPWYDYFNNAKIKNKLENYTFLQANLNVKVVINASPFFYGCAYVAYEPLPQYEPCPIDETTANEVETVGFSQRPHFCIYAANNQGGNMLLPFINKEDWLDITTASSLQNMGKMKIISPADLKNANGVSSQSVSIQIYAWAQDVRLCGPTMSAALQGDEYSTEGVISKPASAIAEAASCLESVPIIGPYATATSFVAGAVASVAAWFGWTNAPIVEDVKPFKDMPFHSMASAEISQPVDKLTLDPKNELTIDPRTIGLSSEDELVISSLVTKESFLGVSTWAQTDAIDAELFAARILPEYYRSETITNRELVQGTPLWWLSQMFSYWRGDIIFRFRFVCSKYHKGRVLFSWDPDANISTTAGSATTNFSRIVDISEESDVEIRCNYMQATTFMRVEDDRSRTNLVFNNSATLASHDGRYDNGILTCRVFTQQSSPVASAPIQVFVSVRGADNLEFAAPKEISFDYSAFTVQSEELEYGAPPEVALTGEGTGSDDKHKNLVYMGETMKSLRQLLRRTTLSRITSYATNTTARFWFLQSRRSRFPLPYGYDPNGVDTVINQIAPVTTKPFNLVVQHPLNWVRMCYLGCRGSVRWMYNFQGNNAVSNFRARRIQTARVAANYDYASIIPTTDSAQDNIRTLLVNLKGGSAGQSVTNQLTQTGLAVEYPMYSRFRMMTNNQSKIVLGFENDESDLDSTELELLTSPVADTAYNNPANQLLYSYCSAGTDFTCLYFMNVPTLWYNNSVPTTSA